MSKQKSFFGLVAAAILCMAVLIMPVTTNADSSGGLTLTATPSVTTVSLGETISYNYVITSTCNTTISSLVLTDDKFGTISLPATSLAPGENVSVSLAYTVATADFPGPIATTSSVTGITADNETRSASMATSITLNPLTSSLQISMSANVSSANTGDNITYTYTITNNGQAGLSALVLTDSRLGAVTLSSTSLAAGASLTATKTYTLLSSDQPGPLSSSSTATATSSTGAAVTATSATVSVTLNSRASSIKVTMSADKRMASENESISYTYTIVNIGQVKLSKIVLTDTRLGTIVLTSDNLSPQAKLTASGKYKVLASDFPGPLVSSATVKAENPSGQQVSDTSKPVSVMLKASDDDDEIDDNHDDDGHNGGHDDNLHLTKGEILRLRGVPGKGIDHAPGLQKLFNMHKGQGKGDNKDQGHQNNEKGKDK
ncbi:MAG: hypothetical protein NTZ34_11555 [Chloroflexi bacterium]|nr:hypothetical protein [Chloroflexota bacterium]